MDGLQVGQIEATVKRRSLDLCDPHRRDLVLDRRQLVAVTNAEAIA